MKTLILIAIASLFFQRSFSQTWEASGTNDIVNSNSGDVIIGNWAKLKFYGKIYSLAAKSNSPMNGEFIGSSEWWGFRTDLNSTFHFDIHNNNSPKSVFSINQKGQAYFNARKSDDEMDGEIFGSSAYWGFRTDTNNRFHLDTYNNNSPISSISVLQNGRVGIGTIDPLYKLQVNSNNAGNFRLVSNGSTPGMPSVDIFDNVNGTEFVISPSTGKVDLFAYSNHALALGTSNTERMRVQPNGHVGINTTNPLGRLDINADGGQLRLSGGTIAGGVWTSIDRLYLADWETGSKGLHINMSDGNVGIGTTDPKGYKLAVNGKTITTEVVVKLYGNWPDYVFEPSYNLPSLSELEQYIKTNKHLPEVPTANEIKENGLSVGEMNAILLKKVEELTLHLIEQNKKIDNLEKELKEVKTKLK